MQAFFSIFSDYADTLYETHLLLLIFPIFSPLSIQSAWIDKRRAKSFYLPRQAYRYSFPARWFPLPGWYYLEGAWRAVYNKITAACHKIPAGFKVLPDYKFTCAQAFRRPSVHSLSIFQAPRFLIRCLFQAARPLRLYPLIPYLIVQRVPVRLFII